MSEYQYYEFLAIDRVLSSADQRALREISSRATISSTHFVNEYSFGDFKGDAVGFLHRWFDAHVYFANWGTYRFYFSVPGGNDYAKLYRKYLGEDGVSAKKSRIVLQIEASQDGGDYVEDEGWMKRLIAIRREVMSGDLRPLYIGWLAGICSETSQIVGKEPPVPAGLKKLSPAQESLVEFLQLSEKLTKIAFEPSPPLPKKQEAGNLYDEWLKKLSPADLREVLKEVLESDDLNPLRARVRKEMPLSRQSAATIPGKRSSEELIDAAFG